MYKFLENCSIWIGVLGCWLSLTPWIMWSFPNINVAIMALFLLLRIPFWSSKLDYSTLISISSVVFFSFIYCQFFIIPIKMSIFQLLVTILPIVVFLLFDYDDKMVFLKRLINTFSLILLISILYFLLHFFIDLPYIIYKHFYDAYAPFKNYFLFVIESDGDFGWFTRFQSIYTEPGHLSMTCAIFLYINGYSWKKWQNIVLTIGLIWSFSLAGFALYFIGLILYTISISKNIFLTIFKVLFSAVVLVILGIAYYSPKNNDMLSVMILSRLEYDESKGISGNNRNSDVFDNYFENFLKSDQRYLGIGRREMDRKFTGTGNSSYKNYVVCNGLVGTFAIIGLMLILLYCYPSRKGVGLMLLLCASFIQRPYFLWLIQVIPYITAISQWSYSEQNIKMSMKHSLSVE